MGGCLCVRWWWSMSACVWMWHLQFISFSVSHVGAFLTILFVVWIWSKMSHFHQNQLTFWLERCKRLQNKNENEKKKKKKKFVFTFEEQFKGRLLTVGGCNSRSTVETRSYHCSQSCSQIRKSPIKLKIFFCFVYEYRKCARNYLNWTAHNDSNHSDRQIVRQRTIKRIRDER